jgi:hypothetical protein
LLGDNWTRGETDERTFSWDYAPYVEDAGDLAVVAFISDRTTGRILQAAAKYADSSVGVGEPVMAPGGLQIYPNPVKDRFYVNLGDESTGEGYYRIMDVSGNIVMDGQVPPGYQILEINIEHFDPGMFLIQWSESGAVRAMGKILKAK